MNDNKKTIILGVVAVLLLAGIIWYGGYTKQLTEQVASIVGGDEPADTDEPAKPKPITLKGLLTGDPDAMVTIVEYSSHFCGYCIEFHQTSFPKILENYVETGKVRLVQVLLSDRTLGMALLCAQDQGKAFELNNYLFEHIRDIKSFEDLNVAIAGLDMDVEVFGECLNSGKYESEIEAWYDQFNEMGIEGTPTFFINDQMIVGNQEYEVFEAAIEEELAKFSSEDVEETEEIEEETEEPEAVE